MIKLIMVIIIAILIYLSYEDVRTRTVQLKLLITAAVLAFVKASLYMLEYKVGIGIQLFLVTPGTIMLLEAVICRESNIGVGDGMTYIILGLMFGLSGYLVAVSVAFIISLAVCVPALCLRRVRLTDNIPMIPFLTTGAIAGYIFERTLNI